MGFSSSTAYFTEKLIALGIAVPRPMIEGMRLDGEINIGNTQCLASSRRRRHQPQHTIKPTGCKMANIATESGKS